MIDNSILHDGFFEGLRIKEDGSARLFFRDVGGQHYELDLDSLEYLLANEFRKGNIILDLTIYQGTDYDVALLERLFGAEYLGKNPDFLNKLQHRIEVESLTLVSIDPSYGCSFVALCKTATWRKAKSA